MTFYDIPANQATVTVFLVMRDTLQRVVISFFQQKQNFKKWKN